MQKIGEVRAPGSEGGGLGPAALGHRIATDPVASSAGSCGKNYNPEFSGAANTGLGVSCPKARWDLVLGPSRCDSQGLAWWLYPDCLSPLL